jgi:hypothetical protein
MTGNYEEDGGNVKSSIRNEEVSGSIPLGSTNPKTLARTPF